MSKAKKETKAANEQEKLIDLEKTDRKFIEMMNKNFGEGTIFNLQENPLVSVSPVSTYIPSMDYISGAGGYPLGRMIEVFGEESSGKTTLALYAIRSMQERISNPADDLYGKKILFMDAEHALDPIHVDAIGVDTSPGGGLVIVQPDSAENGYDIIRASIESGMVAMVVLDSIASMVPESILNSKAEDNHMAVQARLNGKMLSIIKNSCYEHNTILYVINQTRSTMAMHGNPMTTPGGKTLKFYASQRIYVRRKPITKGTDVLGQEITVKFEKNKVGTPFKTTTFDYYFNGGIDLIKDIMNTAIDMGIIYRGGAYYVLGQSYEEPFLDANGNEMKWRGRDTLEVVLKNSPELYAYIRKVVMGVIPKGTFEVEETPHIEDEIDELEAQAELEI